MYRIGSTQFARLWQLLSAATLVVTTGVSAAALAQPPKSMLVEVPAGRFVGLPIHWTDIDAVVLERTGKMHILNTLHVQRQQILNDFFAPQSLPEARVELQAELGPEFEVVVAGPYVVAAPQGQAKRWQERFNRLLAGYIRYFEVRGWQLRQPDFPLVVIVFPSREEFRSYAVREVTVLPTNVVGSYFPRSNRCVLYQIPSSERGTDWEETEATVVHEAIHQLAYNTGVHERLFSNPLWCVEGLATMFESPAVYDSSVARSTLVDRMHAAKRLELQPLLEDTGQLAGELSELVRNDRIFAAQPLQAYALSWGLTFYLTERMPREYANYLELQHRRGFAPYSPAEREIDFQRAFGTTANDLAPQLRRLLAD